MDFKPYKYFPEYPRGLSRYENFLICPLIYSQSEGVVVKGESYLAAINVLFIITGSIQEVITEVTLT
jgi:hypothetical protein